MKTASTAPVGDVCRGPSKPPRVSIGLPVYNGENYLQAAIESILAQDFEDFELLIGDNGSTDATPDICRAAAARDARVVVHRSDVNRGAAWNFNRLVDLARGEYFKWASHDDVLAPAFLRRCIEVLDRYPDVSLAYARCVRIDATGQVVAEYVRPLCATEPRPAQRAASVVLSAKNCLEVFGVMRRNQLQQTGKIGSYTGSDCTLLLELALRGTFLEVPDQLFLHREHPERSMRQFSDGRLRNIWFDPSWRGRRSAPWWRLFREYSRAAVRGPIPLVERAQTLLTISRWAVHHRKGLAYELGDNILMPVFRIRSAG